MNIAFDLDDTITRCPAFFSAISKALLDAGHKVYIITYREDRQFAEEDLAECGVAFSELVLPGEADFRGIPYEQWRAQASQWKARVCRTLGIDVFFDDMPEVINAIGNQTALFMAVDPSRGNVKYGE